MFWHDSSPVFVKRPLESTYIRFILPKEINRQPNPNGISQSTSLLINPTKEPLLFMVKSPGIYDNNNSESSFTAVGDDLHFEITKRYVDFWYF